MEPPSPAPPESPESPDLSVGALVRQAVTRSVGQLLRHDPGARRGDPDDVHKFRVGTRRLRSDLGTFRLVLDPEWAKPLRRELSWLGGEVGAVRDLDVLLERLTAQVATLAPVDSTAADSLVGHFRRARVRAHAALQQTLLGQRYTDLLHDLVTGAETPRFSPPNAALQSGRELGAEVGRGVWETLRQAVDDLPDDPPDEELHQVRILAKRCRYAAEAVAPAIGPDAAAFAQAIADLQTVLGDHQDTVLTEAALRRAADALPHLAPLAGELIVRERTDRARLRAEWPAVWEAAAAEDLRRWMAPPPPV
ncbi:MAG TPA: CHAD domain-containing protein [Acidimicrobiales bacterium]|nr:CHAD domain-containing protein [Acidimicrobiales bacterium]